MMEFLGVITYGITDIIMGVIAVSASFALFLYPVPTFCWRVFKEQSIEDLQPYSYIAINMTSIVWMAYAGPIYGTPDEFHKFCLLNVGTFCVPYQMAYLWGFYRCTTPKKRFIIACTGWGEFLFFIVIPLMMGCRPVSLNSPDKIKVLGPLSVFFGLVMYASPLLTIIEAYRTRRIELLPFGYCIFFCLNAIAWFSYAFLYPPTFDSYIAIANGGGIVLVVIQLILCFIFRVKLQDSGVAAEDSTPLLHETP